MGRVITGNDIAGTLARAQEDQKTVFNFHTKTASDTMSKLVAEQYKGSLIYEETPEERAKKLGELAVISADAASALLAEYGLSIKLRKRVEKEQVEQAKREAELQKEIQKELEIKKWQQTANKDDVMKTPVNELVGIEPKADQLHPT